MKKTILFSFAVLVGLSFKGQAQSVEDKSCLIEFNAILADPQAELDTLLKDRKSVLRNIRTLLAQDPDLLKPADQNLVSLNQALMKIEDRVEFTRNVLEKKKTSSTEQLQELIENFECNE